MARSERRVVLELDGLHWASETLAVEASLGRRPGVLDVEANSVGQTATVTYDPDRTTVEDLAGWVRDCGYHCRGESVADHLCPPAGAPQATGAAAPGHDMAGHDMAAMTGAAPDRTGTPADVMGHGGHGETSMAAMVQDMRNRFGVAALLGVVITLWSSIGREVFGFGVAAIPILLNMPASAAQICSSRM